MPALARDKKGKATRRATRNVQGKFMKTKKPTIDFFAFPYEIRAMVYTYHFAYERPSRTPRTIQEPQSNLKSKLALLRASKATRAEAKPIFYRTHIFHFPIPLAPSDEVISGSLARPNRLITSVQLSNPYNMSVAADYNVLERDLTLLHAFLQHLPNLRFLRVGFALNRYKNNNTDHALARADSPICRILAELWQQLNRLEVYMRSNNRTRHWSFRVAIAPESQWILEDSGAAASMRGYWWSIWALQPARGLSDVAATTNA